MIKHLFLFLTAPSRLFLQGFVEQALDDKVSLERHAEAEDIARIESSVSCDDGGARLPDLSVAASTSAAHRNAIRGDSVHREREVYFGHLHGLCCTEFV